jgi:hypothetical protein
VVGRLDSGRLPLATLLVQRNGQAPVVPEPLGFVEVCRQAIDALQQIIAISQTNIDRDTNHALEAMD